MSDFALQQIGIGISAPMGWDMVRSSSDLTAAADLEGPVAISLFNDAPAQEGDDVPGTDRGGWWADSALPVVPGDVWGSRWWLRYRRRLDQETLDLLVSDALEALQWMKDDQILDVIEVLAVAPTRNRADVTIRLYRPNADPVEYRFNRTWDAQAAKR